MKNVHSGLMGPLCVACAAAPPGPTSLLLVPCDVLVSVGVYQSAGLFVALAGVAAAHSPLVAKADGAAESDSVAAVACCCCSCCCCC